MRLYEEGLYEEEARLRGWSGAGTRRGTKTLLVAATIPRWMMPCRSRRMTQRRERIRVKRSKGKRRKL